MGKNCDNKLFDRKFDMCKLGETKSSNIVISKCIENAEKFLGLKFTCPLEPITIHVSISSLESIESCFS
jgi:hypothetical protein